MATKMATKMAAKGTSGDTWKNYGQEIYEVETSKDDSYGNKHKGNFTTGAIKKASLQWYKMKWQFTASANDLWGEEAQGYAENVEATPLGANCPLFKPGGLSQIRLRFFNLLRGDDASNDFRCAFLKFGDGEDEGPFDLAFITGRVSCYDSVSSLQHFLTAMDGDDDSVRDWALYQPSNYYALVDGLRRFPKCWSDLDFYNHATYSVDTEDGRKLIRFRLHGSRDAESRLSREEQEDAWIIGRPDDIELPSDTYLHDNINNVTRNNCHTRLQVQIRDRAGAPKTELSPSYYWDDEQFPWQDLSDIALTYCVPKDQSERARYNFTMQNAENIQMETPTGTDNFGGMIQIREKVLTGTTRRKRPEPTPDKKEKTTTFLVHVETGSCLFAGTDAGVYISVYGTQGRTKKVLLDKLFHDDFERGSKEAYYITVPVIGDILFLNVFLIGGKYTLCREWFLSNIVIFDLSTRKLCEVPCNRWISDKLTLPSGTATLSQYETNLDRKLLRRLYLEEQDKLIPWGKASGLPGKIGYATYEELPIDLKFASERDWQKKFIITDVLLKLKLHQYSTAFHSFDSFEEFKVMSDVIPNSETSRKIKENEAWRTDEEFGRQYLYGVNPVLICGMTKPLEKFPVTHEMVGQFLDRGLSLTEEIKAGHIYYVDYKHFHNIPRRSGETPKYLAEPIIMFYVRSSCELVPIAIQLEQEPGPNNPIWTPADTELDWLLSKIWVKSADSHYQTIYTHLLRVHLVMEALTVALLRKLPSNHPVYKILMPHAKYTVAVSQKGRDVLVSGENSVFDQILALNGLSIVEFMAARFKCFTYDELVPPRDLASRGVADTDKLPRYRFRDDAILIWDRLVQFVTKLMGLFYKTDSDVTDDPDLQAFVKDVHDYALPSYGSKSNGVPQKLETIPDMVEFVSMFMYQSSVYHAAMNYSQVDYFAFGPNYPGGLRKPPPTTRGQTTMVDIIETLPNKAEQAMAIAFSAFLSEPLADEVYLPDNTDNYFTETASREILDWFSDELADVSRIIEDRNTDYDIPYLHLLPERIPKSAGQ